MSSRAKPVVGLRSARGLDGNRGTPWESCTNGDLFEEHVPCVTPEGDMVIQAFQQAYTDACYRALVGQDALRAYGANEEFQIAIDARHPAKYQENQAFIRDVVDRFYDDLLSVVMDVTDAEDQARFGSADTIGPAPDRHGGKRDEDSAEFGDAQGGDDGEGGGLTSSGPGQVRCKSLSSTETWLHYVIPVLGRIVVRNGFFMCFWHSTVGERVGQLECRASRQVMEINISHVHVPLHYHFRYKGRGVTAVSLIPIGDSLTDVTEQNAEVAAIAQQVASAFSLLPYETAGDADPVAVHSALADNETGPSCYRFLPRHVQAHFGRDGRYYILGNMHWYIPWLNSRPAGDHALQRFSCVSPRLLARKGVHLSCRAFTAEAFIVENKSALRFMTREIEGGIAQLLTDEREAAVRHVLNRQRQHSARRQARRLAEYKARLSQINADSASVTVSASRASKHDSDTNTVEMTTKKAPHSSQSTASGANPLSTPVTASLGKDRLTDNTRREGAVGADKPAGALTSQDILALWREFEAAADDPVSSQSSDDGSDSDSVSSMDRDYEDFRRQDRSLANAELLGAHPLEDDNTINPFSSGSIVERFHRVGYPKSLLGVLLLSLMRFPSPPYHMVREVKREIMTRGLKGYILEKTYDARFGVQQILTHLRATTTTNGDVEDPGSETSSVAEGTVVHPAGADAALARGKRKHVWSTEPGAIGEDDGNLDGSCRDPLLYSLRDGEEDTIQDKAPRAQRSRVGTAFDTVKNLAQTFLGKPTTRVVVEDDDDTGARGVLAPTAHAPSTTNPTGVSLTNSLLPLRTGSGARVTETDKPPSGRVGWSPLEGAAAAATAVGADGAMSNGVVDQDFGSIVERVLVSFMQYDGTELPRRVFARVSTMLGGEGDAWAESDVLNTLYMESILPYVYRKFRLEPHLVDLHTPLSAEDKMIVYQRVCESLGVCMRNGRADSCQPSVKDFRPSSKLVRRAHTDSATTATAHCAARPSMAVGEGGTRLWYTVPRWIRTRTDWLVRRLMLNPSTTRQEWDLYGAALVPFLSIQRYRCLPATRSAIEKLRSLSWQLGHRGGAGRKPLPPMAVLGPMLLNQVQNMSTAPQLLWHAWAKDCFAFKDKDNGSTGQMTYTGHYVPHRSGDGGGAGGAGPSAHNTGSLSLSSQGLDQCVDARRAAMRSAGDRACLVYLLRRQAATYAVVAREIARQKREAPPESKEWVSRLVQMQSRALTASVSTMRDAISQADTLLEHLGNPYSFQYRRYSAELVRYVRARRDLVVATPRFTPTTPTTPESSHLSSGATTSAGTLSAPTAWTASDAAKWRRTATPTTAAAAAVSPSPLAYPSTSPQHSESGNASLLLNDSAENSLKLASDEEVALLHMLHQIQKYCSQDLLAALDHLQRGVLLFNVAYAQEQAALDEQRSEDGLNLEDVALNAHMCADPNMNESLDTSYRLLRALDGNSGLYTLRALANLCLYYYATGNFVNYQECMWRLRRSWVSSGPPDIRALVVAAPMDFAAARAALARRHKAADMESSDNTVGTSRPNNGREDGTGAPTNADDASRGWLRRRRLRAIQFRHLDHGD